MTKRPAKSCKRPDASPRGKAEYCWLSYEPENEVARQLYRSFGFVEAAEMPEGWDEIPAVLKL